MRRATLFQVAKNKEFEQNFRQNMMASVTTMGQYVPVLSLEPVCTVDVPDCDDVQVCEYVFGIAQDGNAATLGCNYSMSVGDVVNVDAEWYRCTSMGWSRITGEPGATGTIFIERKEDAAMEAITNNTINNTTVQEETVMNETIILNGTEEERIAMAQADVEGDAGKVMDTFGKIYKGLKNGKNCINRTKAKVVEDINDDVETIKGGIGTIIGLLDIIGITSLKAKIERIIYAGVSSAGAGKSGSLTDMAEECTSIIYEEIEFLKLAGDNVSLKQAASLKAFVTKDGRQVRGKNIFELIASVLYWLVVKTISKMKEWFGMPKDKMPKVLRMLFSGVTMLLDLVLAGVRIVLFIGARAIGFVVAAAVKVGMFLVNTVKTIFGKVKGFKEASDSLDNAVEDDCFEEEEETYIF